MQGVEVLIAVVSNTQINFVYQEIFEHLIEDNLMENCTVVLKVLSDHNILPLHITAKNALKETGFIGDKWKGNACEFEQPENSV